MKINNEFKEQVVNQKTYYKGLGTATILAVNPSAEEYEKLTGIKPKEEFEYVSLTKSKDIKGNEIEAQQVNITLYLQPEDNNMPVFRLSFKVINSPFISNTDKVELVDIYNNTVWLSPEEALKIDLNKNQQFTINKKDGSGTFITNMFAPIRLSYKGEVAFNHFCKEYNQTKDIQVWDNDTKTFVISKELNDDYEVAFSKEDWDTFFKNPNKNSIMDILKALIESKDAKGNNRKIKFIIGVKTSDDGKISNRIIAVKGAHRKGFTKYELDNLIKNNQNVDFLTNGNLEPIKQWANIPTPNNEVSNLVNNDSKQLEDLPF